ncbi:hypothetical protein Aspvir_003635 [Aspergillus viridinutans]|uniref:Uncharacterized protein n=1 Tax=Aspergillus viridinutans TaxID=75553 RepID=A0A9P3F2J0_ASPVI|nr:uncharacterized protein Aspvir_003635 [Aspergillus viridinutans]GIJ99634.1 hypothetical protein Aspvir_003635 [Aspergillus viridinutans]
MADIEFNNFLNDPPFSYHDEDIHRAFDQWCGVTFLESPAATSAAPIYANNGSDDIEHIYTVLHKGVDQVAAKLSAHTPPRLDQIKEQNRMLIDKLTSLESAITRDTTAVALGPSASAPDMDRERSGAKKRRVSQSTGPGRRSGLQQQSQGYGRRSPSFGGLEVDSKLAKKLLQIGNQETGTQVAEFAAQLKAAECQDALPTIYQFSDLTQVTDVSHFLRVVLHLGWAIESSIFGEQNSRIKKRIALAHFYNAYKLAQDQPDLFLSWCDDRRVRGGSILPKGGHKSVVQHRFADLIFSRGGNHVGMPSARPLDNGDDAKRRTAKIQMWRKSGKKWAQIIQRFGYGILLLLPSSLSDEDLRVASDKDIASALDLIDSRKHLFADILQQANELLEAHFFPQGQNAPLINSYGYGRFGAADWDDFLNISALGN